ALGVGCRLGRRRDDRVQGLERRGRELLHAAHVHLPAPHLLDHLAHLPMDVLHQLARFEGGGRALLRQPAHLFGHHREPLAVLDACAASVPSSDTRRDTRARLSVASRPPDTSLSSASTPWRIVPVDWATAPAAWRIDSAARASVASCCVSVSTVSTSGRRSSVMWIAVASWFANVLIVITSFPRYTLRLWFSSSRVPITCSPNLRGTMTRLCTTSGASAIRLSRVTSSMTTASPVRVTCSRTAAVSGVGSPRSARPICPR